MNVTNWSFNRAQRSLLTIAAFVVVIAGMRAASAILVPFLLAVFLAILANPFMAWLRQKGLPTGVALLIAIVLFLVVGFGFAALVGTSLNQFSASLPSYQRALQDKLNEFFQSLNARGLPVSSTLLMEYIDPAAAMRLTSRVLSGLGNVLSNALFIVIMVAFMLLESAVFSKKLEQAMGSTGRSMEGLGSFFKNINQYIVIKTGASLSTGILAFILLKILGVDYALLWALITFLFNYVPTIGSIIASIPPILVALIQIGPWTAFITAIGYFSINTLIGSILEPRIMGQGLGLSTLIVLISLFFWGWVLGPVGMLLSVPLTMSLKIGLSVSDETRWISTLLDSSPMIRLPGSGSGTHPEG